jgi:transcriptional regulator with XRE-family HTH domain
MDFNELKLLSEINPESIIKAHKINIIFKFMNIKAEQPNLTQEQICKKLGISSSTIKRIRTDLNVKSPYRYDVPLKNRSKHHEKKIETIIPPKDTIQKSVKNKKKEVHGFGISDEEEKKLKSLDVSAKISEQIQKTKNKQDKVLDACAQNSDEDDDVNDETLGEIKSLIKK